MDNLEKIKEFMKSQSFKDSLREYNDKLNKNKHLRKQQLERFYKIISNDIDSNIQKIIDKYESTDYVRRWYSRGIVPPTTLLYVLYSIAEQQGNHIETDNEFSDGGYILGSYIFQCMIGQGTCIVVDKM